MILNCKLLILKWSSQCRVFPCLLRIRSLLRRQRLQLQFWLNLFNKVWMMYHTCSIGLWPDLNAITAGHVVNLMFQKIISWNWASLFLNMNMNSYTWKTRATSRLKSTKPRKGSGSNEGAPQETNDMVIWHLYDQHWTWSVFDPMEGSDCYSNNEAGQKPSRHGIQYIHKSPPR